MARIISVINQKGGVAKTTTVTNLGAALVNKGKRVLLVDFDPQANCSNSVGVDDESLGCSIYNLLTSKKVTKEGILEVIHKTSFDNLFVLPSDITLADAEQTLSNVISRETILKKILEQVSDEFDYIFIDCPPSLGLLSINALVASTEIIIPVYPSYFSIKGIKHLIRTFNVVKENLRPDLQILGVLITKFDQRKNIAKEIRQSLVDVFGDKVFKSIIRVNSQIEYAQDSQIPVINFNNDCNGYKDYINLANEVILNEQ